jgi:hypothetical protein
MVETETYWYSAIWRVQGEKEGLKNSLFIEMMSVQICD